MRKFLAGLLLMFAATGAVNAAQNGFVVPPEFEHKNPSNVRLAPSYVDARVLAANTAESHTPPANAQFVLFSQNCAAIYVNTSTTAAVPAADVTDGTASELNPTAYFFTSTPTAISIISPTTCTVTLAFYTQRAP